MRKVLLAAPLITSLRKNISATCENLIELWCFLKNSSYISPRIWQRTVTIQVSPLKLDWIIVHIQYMNKITISGILRLLLWQHSYRWHTHLTNIIFRRSWDVCIITGDCLPTCNFKGPMFLTGGGWQGRFTTKMWLLREAELTRLDTVTVTLNSPVLQRVKQMVKKHLRWAVLGYKNELLWLKYTHLRKMCCSVLRPSLEDPSPKLQWTLMLVPVLTRQCSVTVRFSRTDAWWSSRFNFTGLWMISAKTSELREVPSFDMTTTTSYLR